MTASFHCCGTFPARQMWVVSQDGPVLLKNEFQQFRGKPVRPHCFLVCRCLHRCGNLLLRGLDPEGTRDWLLRQPLRYFGIEHVGFRRVQQRTEESHHRSRLEERGDWYVLTTIDQRSTVYNDAGMEHTLHSERSTCTVFYTPEPKLMQLTE